MVSRAFIVRRETFLLGMILVFCIGFWFGRRTQISTNPPPLHRKPKLSTTSSSSGSSNGKNIVSNEMVKYKDILLYGSMEEMAVWPELDLFKHILQNKSTGGSIACTDHRVSLKISVSNNVSDFQGKDAVIFGLLGKALNGHLEEVLNTEPFPNQTWIYYSTETPHRIAKWTQSLRFKELKYHVMMTYRHDSEVQIPFGYYRKRSKRSPVYKRTNADHALSTKSRLIYWMGSNCGEVYWPRMGYIHHFKNYLPLETYGKCGKYDCLPARSEKCVNDLSNKYRFALSIANNECRDYITEKLWANALKKFIIPVVYGAPKQDFQKFAPPRSFIHISDFENADELGKYLKKLAQNDDMYKAYFDWKKEYEIVETFPVHPRTLCELLPHLYNGTRQRTKHLGDSSWFKGCRTPVTNSTFKVVLPKFQIYHDFEKWDIWRP